MVSAPPLPLQLSALRDRHEGVVCRAEGLEDELAQSRTEARRLAKELATAKVCPEHGLLSSTMSSCIAVAYLYYDMLLQGELEHHRVQLDVATHDMESLSMSQSHASTQHSQLIGRINGQLERERKRADDATRRAARLEADLEAVRIEHGRMEESLKALVGAQLPNTPFMSPMRRSGARSRVGGVRSSLRTGPTPQRLVDSVTVSDTPAPNTSTHTTSTALATQQTALPAAGPATPGPVSATGPMPDDVSTPGKDQGGGGTNGNDPRRALNLDDLMSPIDPDSSRHTAYDENDSIPGLVCALAAVRSECVRLSAALAEAEEGRQEARASGTSHERSLQSWRERAAGAEAELGRLQATLEDYRQREIGLQTALARLKVCGRSTRPDLCSPPNTHILIQAYTHIYIRIWV